MNRLSLLPLIALVLIGSTALADPIEEVRCREIAFSKAAENRDDKAFRSFIDRDARFVGNRVRRGHSEIVDGWAPFLADGGPSIKWRPLHVEVLDDGKLAFTRGLYRVFNVDADGNESVSWGWFNSTWRLNDDGVWRVVFDTGDPAVRPPTLDEQTLLDQDDDCE